MLTSRDMIYLDMVIINKIHFENHIYISNYIWKKNPFDYITCFLNAGLRILFLVNYLDLYTLDRSLPRHRSLRAIRGDHLKNHFPYFALFKLYKYSTEQNRTEHRLFIFSLTIYSSPLVINGYIYV